MPQLLLLISKWVAIFVLAVCIALIIVRWKFPREQKPAGSTLGYWREVWRHLRRSRTHNKERELDKKALRGKAVLVVDPDERSSRVLIWRLEGLGCVVTKARTGTRGLELAASAKPAIIIADALLPDVPAADVYSRAAAAGLPIVFVGTMKSQRKELASLGDRVACLGKPFDPEEAVEAAGRLLRRTKGNNLTLC